jgi:hypothetical protein
MMSSTLGVAVAVKERNFGKMRFKLEIFKLLDENRVPIAKHNGPRQW